MLLEEIDMIVDAEHNKRDIELNSLQNNLLQMESVSKKSDLPFENLQRLEEWLISNQLFTRNDHRKSRLCRSSC